MSVTFQRDAEFAGLPFRRFRDLLRAWADGGTVTRCAARSNVRLDPSTAAAAMDEALAQGLVEPRDSPTFDLPEGPRRKLLKHWDRRPHGPRPTIDGIAVATSAPSAPLPRAKGQAILDELLGNASRLNARDDVPVAVERIWSYGSLAKGASTVNDVDVVIETSSTAHEELDDDAGACRPWIAMARELGGESALAGLGSMASCALDYLEGRLLHGKRRNPKLSLGHVHTLTSLACECRLVFDRSRGGPVDDPLLPRHPDSPGRGAGAFERLSMPALSAVTSLRPTEACLVDAGEGAHAADPGTHVRDGRGPDGWWRGTVALTGSARDADGSTTDRFTIVADGGGEARWTVRRSLSREDAGYAYSQTVTSSSGSRSTEARLVAVDYLAALARADLERCAMHRLSAAGPSSVRVTLDSATRNASRALDEVARGLEGPLGLGSLARNDIEVDMWVGGTRIRPAVVLDFDDVDPDAARRPGP